MTPLERELQIHARSLRRLARDLVGAADADDLLQETALRPGDVTVQQGAATERTLQLPPAWAM